MKKIIFLFLFFALGINSAFSYSVSSGNYLTIGDNDYQFIGPNKLINNEKTNLILEPGKSSSSIYEFYFDNGNKKFYFSFGGPYSNSDYYYINEDLSLTIIGKSPNCRNKFLYKGNFKCEQNSYEGFDFAPYVSLFGNGVFYRYDDKNKILTIRGYKNNPSEYIDFHTHYYSDGSNGYIYTPTDNTVVSINSISNKHTVIHYNFLTNRYIKSKDFLEYSGSNGITLSYNFNDRFILRYGSDSFQGKINPRGQSLYYAPPLFYGPSQPCPPPYAPGECYNDPNYDPLTPPRDPNGPQGPVSPGGELPKGPYTDENFASCEIFKNGKFIYNSTRYMTFNLTVQDVEPGEAKVGWVDFAPIVNFLRSIYNSVIKNLENTINQFTLLFSNFGSYEPGSYCFLGKNYNIVYQEYFFVDDNNPVRRLLPIQSQFVKGKQNIIDYLALLLFGISLSSGLFYLFIKK